MTSTDLVRELPLLLAVLREPFLGRLWYPSGLEAPATLLAPHLPWFRSGAETWLCSLLHPLLVSSLSAITSFGQSNTGTLVVLTVSPRTFPLHFPLHLLHAIYLVRHETQTTTLYILYLPLLTPRMHLASLVALPLCLPETVIVAGFPCPPVHLLFFRT